MIYSDNPKISLSIILYDHTFVPLQTRYNMVGMAKFYYDCHMTNNRLGG